MTSLTKAIPVKDPRLLRQALTHRSWLNEHPEEKISSNERLEFLGDAVLELVVTEFLFEKFPRETEGALTSLRASLVRTETLATIAQSLKLGELILLSHGEKISGGKENISLLANTFEAIIGAMYIGHGMRRVKPFIRKHVFPELDNIIANELDKDAKSKLQELIQAKGFPAPVYRVEKELGPDHEKTFMVAVFINGKHSASGTGKSKQQAQQKAASLALEKYDVK